MAVKQKANQQLLLVVVTCQVIIQIITLQSSTNQSVISDINTNQIFVLLTLFTMSVLNALSISWWQNISRIRCSCG